MRIGLSYFICFLFIITSKCYSSHNLDISSLNNVSFSSISIEKKDSIGVSKILKKFILALSIKKNIRDKEKQRIIAILDTVLSKDPFSVSKLKAINEELAKTQKWHFDSLSSIITKISLRSDVNVQKSNIKPLDTTQENSDADQFIVNIMPQVDEKADEELAKDLKQKKINEIRLLINKPKGINGQIKINDSITKKYTLILNKNKKGNVFVFHPYWNNNNITSYTFKAITTFAYYGFELNAKTGDCLNLNGWDKAEIIDVAKKNGCKVVLSVYCLNQSKLLTFLKNDAAQNKFFSIIIPLLKSRNADGVNINFEITYGECRNQITQFLEKFSAALKNENPNYELSVTLPAFDEFGFYDVELLEYTVDYFVIDFSKTSNERFAGHIVPLSGDEFSLKSSITRYLSTNVPSKKFIACLPFHGVLWDTKSDSILKYIPYEAITQRYVPLYGKVKEPFACMRTDLSNKNNKFDSIQYLVNLKNQKIWFDDENTISQKYDYIIKSNLGGIGIWQPTDDNKHFELWNSLLFKTVVIDTVDVTFIRTVYPKPLPIELSFFDKVIKELELYQELFNYPCRFDSNEPGHKLRPKSSKYSPYIALFFLILLTAVAVFAMLKRRSKGDDWIYRKLFLKLLIVLVILTILSSLFYFFIQAEFKYLGNRDSDNCESYWKILTLVVIGIAVGMISMRFIIFPLVQRKEIP